MTGGENVGVGLCPTRGTRMESVSCPAQRLLRGLQTPPKMATVKFASIPIKYAPKRKMVDFSLPQWRNRFGEFEDQDLASFINNLYQDKVFKTQKEFNEAYDNRFLELLYWQNKPMILERRDIVSLEETHKNGGFDFIEPAKLDKIIAKMKACLETGEKVVFVY